MSDRNQGGVISAAICDDNPTDAEYVSQLVERWAREIGISLKIERFSSAEGFLFQYAEKKDYDLLLLDIEMGKMDGVTLAKRIREENEGLQIIFITGYSDYIAEGYEVSALHYLVKPVQEEKLKATLNRAVEKLRHREKTVLLELSGETVRLPLHEIRYLEVSHNYVTIHAKEDYTVKKTLGEFEKELGNEFFRAGRSYLIRLSCINRVTKKEVFLTDGTMLPLPRGMYESLNRAIISQL